MDDFIMEHPVKLDDLGGKPTYFRKHLYPDAPKKVPEVQRVTSGRSWVIWRVMCQKRGKPSSS